MSTTRLYKEFVLNGPAVWQLVKELIKEHARAFIERGTPLRLILTTEDRKRSTEANGFYFGVVLRDISEQVFVEGKQFDADAWHTYYAEKFCPKTEVTLPSGEIFLRRKSTSDMGQKEFSDFVSRVQADAANEYSVEFEQTL